MDTDFQSVLAARVADEQSSERLPSLSVAVGVDGMLVAEASAGFADLEHRVAAGGGHSFRIGSITKTFTAALTLSLCDRAELALDAPIDSYLPGTGFGDLTLRLLLSHSSGLQREAPGTMWETMQGPSAAELREAFSLAERVAEPGQRWHYSNLGYAVIGQVIEQVTGSSCQSLIGRHFLEPLELAGTSWAMPSNAAVGYRRDPYADLIHREPGMDQAAVGVGGQLWSTTTDLLRWGHALCGGEPEVVSPTVVDAMHRVQVMCDTDSWKRGWGLGLILERRGDRVTAGHTGAMPGFQSALCIDRRTEVAVVALCNATRGIALNDLAADVAVDAISRRSTPPPPIWEPASPCPDEVAELLGSWWSESDEIVIGWRRGALVAHLATSPATTGTTFRMEAPGRFRAIAGRLEGELLLVTQSSSGVEMRWATYPLTRSPQ
ncbi:serine hydrolase domain-containing protein [Nocardia tengchongensis]|uniref:serine hydrolase domain-containing protein n=1 Tax=Nocardia tengchongensis TaxID=2055889 RepID=UPI0036B65263